MQKERPKMGRQHRHVNPQPCHACGKLTDDEYALSAPGAGYPIICPNCKIERDILGISKDLGWITEEGILTPEFFAAWERYARK